MYDRDHHRAGKCPCHGLDMVDVVVVFDDFMDAAAFGYEAALADGIIKKLLSPITAPLPAYFGRSAPLSEGKSILIAMIASLARELQVLLGGRAPLHWRRRPTMAPARFRSMKTWNHTTLQVLKGRSLRHLPACLYPHDGCWKKWRDAGVVSGTKCCSISNSSASRPRPAADCRWCATRIRTG